MVPGRPARCVRRPVVLRAREHLRDEHGEDDLPRDLRVRPTPGLGAHGDREDGTEIAWHSDMFSPRPDGARNAAWRTSVGE